MYICSCKGITEKQIRDACRVAKGSKKDVLKRLGVGTDCGTCMEWAITRVLEEQTSYTAPPPKNNLSSKK